MGQGEYIPPFVFVEAKLDIKDLEPAMDDETKKLKMLRRGIVTIERMYWQEESEGEIYEIGI